MADGEERETGRPEQGGEQQQRLHRERARSDRREQDAASGPGYTARPTDEEPEPRDHGSRGG